jgi:hypothetical protein
MVYSPGSTLGVAHDFYVIDGHYALPRGAPVSFFACQRVHQEVRRDVPLKEQKQKQNFVDVVGVEIVAIPRKA